MSTPSITGGAAEPCSTGSQEALAGLLRLLRIAEYRQQTVLWTIGACLAIGVAYLAFAPRQYRSTAKLMVIEQRGDEVPDVGDHAAVDTLMATHKELVRSPVVVRRAIESLPPEHRIDLLDVPPDEWVETVTDRLSASTIRKTSFIAVGYESLQPEAASAVVQAVINAYLEFVEENHRGTAAELLNVLTGERDQLEADLAAKQHRLRSERERLGHLALPDKDDVVDPVVARAIHMNDGLMAAQQRRIGLQASLTTVRQAIDEGQDLRQYMGLVQDTVGERMMLAAMGLSESDLAVVAKQQSRLLELKAEADRLGSFYGESHPQMQAISKQVRDTEGFLATYQSGRRGSLDQLPSDELAPLLLSMLQQALGQSLERERQLGRSFDVARAEAARQSGDLVRLDMLDREVKRLESLHDVLFEKIAAVDIHQVHAPIRATIVEEPLPDTRPSSPKLGFTLTASLAGGLVLGVLLAYLQDVADDRFGSPDEIARQLGSAVLSVVRKLERLPGTGFEAVQMHSRPQAVDSEAFRTLRTSIALAAEGLDRLVISSSEPSDGKTTVSANLAVSYAQSGQRTLIIDADLRKPGLTAMLDLKGASGLTDVLSTREQVAKAAERCVIDSCVPNLDVIPAGPRRANPAELLLGDNLADLLAWADRHYDKVLLDCPPVLAVSDAQIVARMVDGIVLVVTPEKNARRIVARAHSRFTESGANVVGIVANRVSDQAGRGYGYGYGYGYGHDESRESSDQASDAATPKIAA